MSGNKTAKILVYFGAVNRNFIFQFAIQEYKDKDVQNYNFAFCFYGCETWSLTVRDERRLRAFENRVLRRIFGRKWEEVRGEWRKLHNEELHGLYSSPNIVRVIKSRRMRWAEHLSRMGERRGVYRVLVGKLEGKRPFGRPWRRWEYNIKLDFQEVVCGIMDWIELAQHARRYRWRALVNAVMKLLAP